MQHHKTAQQHSAYHTEIETTAQHAAQQHNRNTDMALTCIPLLPNPCFCTSWPDYVASKFGNAAVQWELLKQHCNGWRNFNDIWGSYDSVRGIM